MLKSLTEKIIATDESSLVLFQLAHGGSVSSNNSLYERLQSMKFKFLILILKVRQSFHIKGDLFFLY